MPVKNSERQRARMLIAISTAGFAVVFLLISFHMFGELRTAQLRLIDDHEIIRFLGSDHTITVADFPGLLFAHTEVGLWGQWPRLRPVYYTLRIIETSLWGTNAGLWYLTRVVIVALTATGLGVAVLLATLRRPLRRLQAALSITTAFLAGLLVNTLPSWADIATRLGPSEIYVGLALTIFCLGAVLAWRVPAGRAGWVLLTIGYLLAIGSKEDCLVLLVPLGAIAIVKFRAAGRPRFLVVLFILSALGTLYQAIGLALGTAGVDMYGNGRSIGLFVRAVSDNPFVVVAVSAAAIAIIWDASHPQGDGEPVQSGRLRSTVAVVQRSPHAVVAVLSLVVILGDTYLYQNYVVSGTFAPARYAFLSELGLVASFIVILTIICRIIADGERIRWIAAAAALAAVALVGVGSPLVRHAKELRDARAQAIGLAADSRTFHEQVLSGVQDLLDRPGSQALMIVDEPYDYERVFSVSAYLAYYGAADSVFLDVRIPADSASPALLAQLTDELKQMQVDGRHDQGWRIQGEADRDSDSATVCFYFGEQPADLSGCDASQRIG